MEAAQLSLCGDGLALLREAQQLSIAILSQHADQAMSTIGKMQTELFLEAQQIYLNLTECLKLPSQSQPVQLKETGL